MGLLEQAYKSQGKTYTPTSTSSGGLLQQAQKAIQIKPIVKPKVSTPIATTPIQKAKQVLSTGIGNIIKTISKPKAPTIPLLKITPTQKKLSATQIKQLDLGGKEQVPSAQLSNQSKLTQLKLNQIREEYKAKSVEQVRRPIKKGYKEPGVLGSMVEAIKEGVISSVSSLGSTTEMVGNMSRIIALTNVGKKISKDADKILASNPEWAADPMERWGVKKIARLTAGAVPSLLAVIGATLVAGPVGAVATGFGLEAGPTYKEAKEKGVTESKAQIYGTVVGTVNGILERIFPAKLLKGVEKEVVKKVGKSLTKELIEQAGKFGVKFAKNGALEGSTEAIQELWSNVIATNYDKNRKVWDNMLESFVGGFGSGGIAGATIEGKGEIDIQEGEHTPQKVIGEVIKSGAENTPEGKALVKQAVEAQKQGKNVVIEKPQVTKEITSEQANSPEMIKWADQLNKDLKTIDRKEFFDSIPVDKKGNFTIAPKVKLKSTLDNFNKKYGTNITEKDFIDRNIPNRNDLLLEKYKQIANPQPPVEGGVKEGGVSPTVKKVSGGEVGKEPVKAPKPVPQAKEIKVPREQLPVGEGKEKATRLEQRVKETLNRITPDQAKTLGDTMMKEMNNKETIRKASEYVIANPDEAIKVLTGEIQSPKGIPSNAIAIAMINSKTGNYELATKLASLKSTAMGQNIEILKELNQNSPIKLMSDMSKILEQGVKERYNIKEANEVINRRTDKLVERVKKTKIKKLANTNWDAFINSIETC